jgi:hypothetical protein
MHGVFERNQRRGARTKKWRSAAWTLAAVDFMSSVV